MSGETAEHHVEIFLLDGRPVWGWQCFTCGRESIGFATAGDAERGCALHVSAAQAEEQKS